ncbi:head-tail adaptor protein [Sulfitobacter pontiacus]
MWGISGRMSRRGGAGVSGRGGIAVSRGVYVVTVRGAPVGDPGAPRQRASEGTRAYQIQSVAEQDAQGRYLACLTHEEVAV